MSLITPIQPHRLAARAKARRAARKRMFILEFGQSRTPINGNEVRLLGYLMDSHRVGKRVHMEVIMCEQELKRHQVHIDVRAIRKALEILGVDGRKAIDSFVGRESGYILDQAVAEKLVVWSIESTSS